MCTIVLFFCFFATGLMLRARGPYRQKYSTEALHNALRAIRYNGMKHGKAAKIYGIPKSTILDKIKGRVHDDAKMGAPSIMTMSEEKKLCDFIDESSRMGFRLTRQDLNIWVKEIMDKDGRPNRFKNNMPGKHR